MRDDREKRDLHALDQDGMVACNNRDREAAHRAQVEGIATEDLDSVTCLKCKALLPQLRRAGNRALKGNGERPDPKNEL
jgi:hypothetical protein